MPSQPAPSPRNGISDAGYLWNRGRFILTHRCGGLNPRYDTWQGCGGQWWKHMSEQMLSSWTGSVERKKVTERLECHFSLEVFLPVTWGPPGSLQPPHSPPPPIRATLGTSHSHVGFGDSTRVWDTADTWLLQLLGLLEVFVKHAKAVLTQSKPSMMSAVKLLLFFTVDLYLL